MIFSVIERTLPVDNSGSDLSPIGYERYGILFTKNYKFLLHSAYDDPFNRYNRGDTYGSFMNIIVLRFNPRIIIENIKFSIRMVYIDSNNKVVKFFRESCEGSDNISRSIKYYRGNSYAPWMNKNVISNEKEKIDRMLLLDKSVYNFDYSQFSRIKDVYWIKKHLMVIF